MHRMTPRFAATVDKRGVAHLHDKAAWDTWMTNHAGRKVEIAVKEWRNKRTVRQLRAYFGLLVRGISEHTGYEVEEVHEQIKTRFGIETTTTLNTEEMADLDARVRRWAATELGLNLPEPNEVSL